MFLWWQSTFGPDGVSPFHKKERHGKLVPTGGRDNAEAGWVYDKDVSVDILVRDMKHTTTAETIFLAHTRRCILLSRYFHAWWELLLVRRRYVTGIVRSASQRHDTGPVEGRTCYAYDESSMLDQAWRKTFCQAKQYYGIFTLYLVLLRVS